jgi:hypothetical protein
MAKYLKQVILLTSLFVAIWAPLQAEKNKDFTLGYNALEIGVNDSENLILKLHTNLSYKWLDYHGTNQVVGSSHYGRQVLYTGNEHISSLLGFETNNEGIVSWEIGVRNTSLSSLLGDYGDLDAAFNNEQKGLMVTGLFGKIWGQYNFEVFIRTDLSERIYLEFQTAWRLNKHLSIFARIEGAQSYCSIIAGISINT